MLVPIEPIGDRNFFVSAKAARMLVGHYPIGAGLFRPACGSIMDAGSVLGTVRREAVLRGSCSGCPTEPSDGSELAMNVLTILRNKGSDVITTAPSATVMDAARVLADKRIGAVLVLDKGNVVGVVSERDIVRTVATKGVAALYLEVHELMTSDVFTCSRSATIDEVMAMMTERRIRHIPIVEDSQLYGLISIGDVVKCRIEETEREAEALRGYIHAS